MVISFNNIGYVLHIKASPKAECQYGQNSVASYSIIFQLYSGFHFYWKQEKSGKSTDLHVANN